MSFLKFSLSRGMFGEEISAKTPSKRRPAGKKGQRKTATTGDYFFNSASYARISRRDCETSFKQVPAKKRVGKKRVPRETIKKQF